MSLLLSPVSGASGTGASAAGGTSPVRTSMGWGATIGIVCLPAVAGYLAIVALLALLGAASGAAGGAESPMAAVARAGAVGWLVAHQVPLTIDGAPLGVLPLLPTLLLGALVARCAARVEIHKSVDAGWVVGAIAGIHGVLGAVLALVATPTTITADPVPAALGCALVAGVAAGLGLARPGGLLPAALRRAPGWVLPGLVAGTWGLAILLTAGLAAVLIGLVGSAAEVAQMSGSDVGSVLGLTALSIGYLPNAAIAGLSWLAGPGFSIGALSVSPVSPVTMVAGLVPAVPLLAALPQGSVQPWWGVALVIPLLVGAAVGRRCAAAASDLSSRLRVLGVAAMVLALGSAVLATLAGGRLGAAALNPVEVPSGSLAGAVLGATLLGGCAVTLLSFPVAPSPGGAVTDTAGAVDTGDGDPPAERDHQDHEAERGQPGGEEHQPAS